MRRTKRILATYLRYYERQPFLTSLVGFTAILCTFVLFAIAFELLKLVLPIEPDLLVLLMTPVVFFLVVPFVAVVFLANEWLWVTSGVYALLRVTGRPIKDYFSNFVLNVNPGV